MEVYFKSLNLAFDWLLKKKSLRYISNFILVYTFIFLHTDLNDTWIIKHNAFLSVSSHEQVLVKQSTPYVNLTQQ